MLLVSLAILEMACKENECIKITSYNLFSVFESVRLAQTKKCNALYKVPKETPWAVTNSAKKAEPSSKIKLLARPRPRPIINEEYDPFTVTLPALQAIATLRINVLSIPLARRCCPINVFTARVNKSVGVY
jgi:hypothetical protein